MLWVGAFELGLAAMTIFVGRFELMMFVFLWRLATESLFLVCGAPIWDGVEQFGSYAAPLAIAIMLMPFRAASPGRSFPLSRIHSLISRGVTGFAVRKIGRLAKLATVTQASASAHPAITSEG